MCANLTNSGSVITVIVKIDFRVIWLKLAESDYVRTNL